MKTFKIQILFLLSLFFISCSTESEDFEVTVKASNQLGKVSGSGIYGFKKVYIIIEKGSSFYLKSIPFRKDFQRT